MKIQLKRDYPLCGEPRFKAGDEVEAFDFYDAELSTLSGSYKIGRKIFKVKDERGQVWLVEEKYDAVEVLAPVEVSQ